MLDCLFFFGRYRRIYQLCLSSVCYTVLVCVESGDLDVFLSIPLCQLNVWKELHPWVTTSPARVPTVQGIIIAPDSYLNGLERFKENIRHKQRTLCKPRCFGREVSVCSDTTAHVFCAFILIYTDHCYSGLVLTRRSSCVLQH